MIPALLAVSPGDGRDVRSWLAALAARGLPGVLLREPGEADLDDLVRRAVAAVPFVAVHTRHPAARAVARAHGAHLHGRAGERGVSGVSTHDAAELDDAFAAGAGYALLSPVWAPTSKPGDARAPLGLPRFLDLARGRPVLALGGATPDRLAQVLAAGGAGVAVLGALAGPPDALDAFLQKTKSSSS